jgi:benzylsuccinate CoA-transferase BbsF subunit
MNKLLPLKGIRILDFSWVGAGPFVTKPLADHGAEVIKIESRKKMDVIRSMHPFKDGVPGENRSGYFSNRNSSKMGMTLNLKTPQGIEIAKELIKQSDVIVNNFSANVMEKLGLGYEEAKRLNPRIIYLSMPMQGSTGPHKDFKGFGLTIGALCGLLDLSGFPEKEPAGTGTNYPDHAPNPLHGAIAILSALFHRKRTGEGQYIELSQFESTINVLGTSIMRYANNGENEIRRGNSSLEHAPHNVYRCLGEDRWIAVAVESEEEWMCFKKAIGEPEWAEGTKFETAENRKQNEQELDQLIGSWTQTQDAEQLFKYLQGYKVKAGVVRNAEELLVKDEQLAARNHWVYLDHPEMGKTVYDAPPYKFLNHESKLRSAAPLLGQHTEHVCKQILNMDSKTFENYEKEGVFY